MFRFISTAALLLAGVQLASVARADTFFVYEGTSTGQSCGTLSQTSPVKFSGVTCTGSNGTSITGSAKSGNLYLGADISGFSSNGQGSTVGANFDMNLRENQLLTSTAGQLVTFYWQMDGVVSVSGPSNEIGLNLVSNVNGTRVLNPAIPYLRDVSGFYSEMFGTDQVQTSTTGLYNVYLGFDNSIVGSASSDFLNTISLSEVTVTDSTGKPVSGVTFSDNFGDVFAANEPLNSSAPEPNSLTLMFAGTLAFLTAARIKQRRRSLLEKKAHSLSANTMQIRLEMKDLALPRLAYPTVQLISLGLILFTAAGSLRASSLSAVAFSTAVACDANSCAPQTTSSFPVNYTGPYKPGLVFSPTGLASSSTLGATIVTNSAANTSFGYLSAQAFVAGNTVGSEPGTLSTLTAESSGTAKWSDQVTFLKSFNYTFTVGVYSVNSPVGGGSDVGGQIDVIIGGIDYQFANPGVYQIEDHFNAGDRIQFDADVSAGVSEYGSAAAGESFSDDHYNSLQVFLDPSAVQGNASATASQELVSNSGGSYYTTESGFSYLTPSATVPEPGTIGLLLIGALAIGSKILS